MTTPPAPPEFVGAQPQSAGDVNNQIGQHLRSFLTIKNTINQDRDFLAATDLKVAPYNFTADQETLIKSAVLELDNALDGVDTSTLVAILRRSPGRGVNGWPRVSQRAGIRPSIWAFTPTSTLRSA